MHIRLVNSGQKKIAAIKAVRSCYGINLRDAKNLVDAAPVDLPKPPSSERGIDLVKELREYGAVVEAKLDASLIDKLTATSYISTAQVAIGEGNLKECRNSLRAALRLIGDWDLGDGNFFTL